MSDALEFDPSDFERPSRGGITKGLLELPTCSVSVLLTSNEKGEHVASALVWKKADEHPRAEVFVRPTRDAAWAALAVWVGKLIVLALVFVVSACAPRPDVSCAGPLPVSCECATSCDFGGDAGVVVADVRQVVAGCLPYCWRRDTGGEP
jgi:hypothetical protein